MIHFFRRIRKKLFTEGHLSKYFIYALGEILLVIIGILIALFINDWNNEKGLRQSEKEVLSSLRLEFEETQKRIETFIQGNKKIVSTAERFITYCNNSDSNFDDGTFDSLLHNTAWHSNFILNQGVLSEILNTGKLSLISDSKTRVLLSSWTAQVENTKDKENTSANYLNTVVIDYLDKEISWAELVNYDRVHQKKYHTTKKDIDRYQLSQSLRMENFAVNQIWFCEFQIVAAEELLMLNLEILSQLKIP